MIYLETIEEAYNEAQELGYTSSREKEVSKHAKNMNLVTGYYTDTLENVDGICIMARIYQGHSNYSVMLDIAQESKIKNKES